MNNTDEIMQKLTELTEKVENLLYENELLKKSNVLWQKKWYAAGDSFTQGDFSNSKDDNWKFTEGKYKGCNKVYPFYIAERNNMELIADGLCGSVLSLTKEFLEGTEEKNYRSPFTYKRYLNIPSDVDYITLWFGGNDSNNHTILGTINDEDNTTFYGAWNFILKYLIQNYKKAKIGVIITNIGTAEYREATRICCRKWGVPYLDLMGNYQIPPSTGGREFGMGLCKEAADLWQDRFHIECVEGAQNVHPSADWHEFQSTFIENFLRSL